MSPMPDKANPVDSELASRLGQIVIRWSEVEGWLNALLATLVNADPGAMTVISATAGSSTSIQWMRHLINIHLNKQPELQKLLDLLDRADDLRIDRNALAHGTWDDTGCEAGTCLVNTLRWNRAEIISDWLITAADLDELLGHIENWIVDYLSLGKEFGFPRRRGEDRSIFS